MPTDLDAELDRLFQLPLAEFTSERNALAKRFGADGGAIKALSKPPVAAWAVNQLYFRDRDRYDALVTAATDLRKTHKAVLEGRRGDLRAAGREHDATLDAALKSTLSLLHQAGQPVTEATRQAILNTLRALPADEPPGRLTRTLSPGGFEMLAGITPRPGAKPSASSPARLQAVAGGKGRATGISKEDAKAEREAARERERRAAAERAVREADQRARQAEFEAARAARDVAKAEQAVEQARQAVEDAQTVLEDAERAAVTATRAKQTADRRAEEAREKLENARAAAEG